STSASRTARTWCCSTSAAPSGAITRAPTPSASARCSTTPRAWPANSPRAPRPALARRSRGAGGLLADRARGRVGRRALLLHRVFAGPHARHPHRGARALGERHQLFANVVFERAATQGRALRELIPNLVGHLADD